MDPRERVGSVVNFHIINTLDIIDRCLSHIAWFFHFDIDSRNGISSIVCSCVFPIYSPSALSHSLILLLSFFLRIFTSEHNTPGPMCHVSCGRRAPTRVIFEMSIKWITQHERKESYMSLHYLKRAGYRLVWRQTPDRDMSSQLSIWHFHWARKHSHDWIS